MRMTLGSLFDGSGTAPLAAAMCGIEPIWASEIEPYPVKVTTARFPRMKHLGDITKIDGAKIEPVDVICGGSPCQDLSVAGKQAGIHKGERSHLFFEMTRVIKEMREATNGRYPKYVIWENVPGAFSSNGGEDFLAVLQAFAEIAEDDVLVSRPAKRSGTDRLGWAKSGEMVGDGWSIAWRTVDAQYWGVPQRRRRIYLIADFADGRAGEILFESEGLSGDSAAGGAAREGASDDAAGSAGGSRGVKCLNPWDYQTIRQYAIDGVYPAITSNETGGQNRQGVCYAFHLQQDPISSTEKAPCIGGQHQACVGVAAFMGGQGAKAGSVAYSEDISPTIKSVMSGGNTVPDVVYALQGNGIDRADTAGCNGCGWRENECYTLNTIDRPAVAYPETVGALNATDYKGIRNQNVLNAVVYDTTQITSPQNRSNPKAGNPCHTLAAQADPPLCVYDYCGNGDGQTAANLIGDHENRVTDYTNCVIENYSADGICGTIDSHYYKGCGEREGIEREIICMENKQSHSDGKNRLQTNRRYIVRRLTPLECCRLQGFPDWWTDGVDGSDAAKFKMWGNGMALPNVLHVMRGIAREEAGNARRHDPGKGKAVCASGDRMAECD